MFPFSNGRSCSLQSWAATVGNPGLLLDFAWMRWSLQVLPAKREGTESSVLTNPCMQDNHHCHSETAYIRISKRLNSYVFLLLRRNKGGLDFMLVALSYDFLPFSNMKKPDPEKGWKGEGGGFKKREERFCHSVLAFLNNESPSQATLHKVSGTCYQWLGKVLLQLLVCKCPILYFPAACLFRESVLL